MIIFKFFENHFFLVRFLALGRSKTTLRSKKRTKKMVFEKFKNYHILRYIIYEFLKKVSGGTGPTCLGPCR